MKAIRGTCETTNRPWASQETHVGADYDAEELEFLKAVDRHKRATGRPFPTCRDFLRILRSLGWRKEKKG